MKGKDDKRASKRTLLRLSARRERQERQQQQQREDDDRLSKRSQRAQARRLERERLREEGLEMFPQQHDSRDYNNDHDQSQDQSESKANADEKERDGIFDGVPESERDHGTTRDLPSSQNYTTKDESAKISTVKFVRENENRALDVERADASNSGNVNNEAMIGAFPIPGIDGSQAHTLDVMLPPSPLDIEEEEQQTSPVVLDGHLPEDREGERENVLVVEGKRELGMSEELAQRRKRLLAITGCVVVVSVIVSTVAIILGNRSSSDAPIPSEPTSPISSLEDQDNATRYFLEDTAGDLGLDVGPNTPHELAVKWIVEEDPLSLTMASENILQRYALALMYYQTTDGGTKKWKICNPVDGGEDDVCNSSGNSRWLTGTNECTWHGVRCGMNGTGAIRTMDLRRTGLSGPIPSALFLLSELVVLRLSVNANMTGTIPERIYDLKRLTYLNFRLLPSLVGTISTRVGELTNLLSISISSSDLSGSLPSQLGLLRRLKNLDLTANKRIEGSLPKEIYHMSKLVSLGIRATAMTGTLGTGVGKLIALEDLFLDSTNLSGSLPTEIGQCTKLALLQIHKSSFTGSIPSEIGKTALVRLHAGNEVLGMPTLTGSLPEELFDLTALIVIGFQVSSIEGTLSTRIGRLTNLLQLGFFESNLSGSLPSELGLLSDLNRIDLLDSSMSGSLPSEIGNLSKLTLLRLPRNNFGGVLPSDFGWLQRLAILNLSDNNLSGALPSELGLISTNLRIVRVEGNDLTGSIPSEIAQSRALGILNLGRNQLSGSLPSEIGLLSDVVDLSLNRNLLGGAIPSQIGLCLKLLRLQLGSNNLTGGIPVEIENLQALEVLSLQNNPGIAGSIPKGFYTLHQLDTVVVQNASLTGSLLTSIGQLTNLKFFDVSNNMLRGTLPSEIGLLESLETLKVHGTELVGTVTDAVCNFMELTSLVADCRPVDDPPMVCGCCSRCCNRESSECVKV